ncbi:2-aminoethylphosphonate--pyruvate transaminase [Colwelliaceae bacterium MEBiC 14330]
MEHYKLLTPGPLTTSATVKAAMLKDWCTWDDDYNLQIVQKIRQRIVALATNHQGYTSVLMQGSGTASVESVLGSAIGDRHKVLVINNGAYGQRMAEICTMLSLKFEVLNYPETTLPDTNEILATLQQDQTITHLAMVHCETTTGMLNPITDVAKICQQTSTKFILDAMSSFGGIEFDIGELDIDFMISSANKCIQGVPGFGFIIGKIESIQACKGQAKSLSLDLYDQWYVMETQSGKWRFTSPTHVVRAFDQALEELAIEGGISARASRYQQNQIMLTKGMIKLGFQPLLAESLHSPIITSFYSPASKDFQFIEFYNKLKEQGFVIYPGKVSTANCFRIGNIGEIYPTDIDKLLSAIALAKYWED